MQTLWKSEAVTAGTSAYATAKARAEVHRLHAQKNLCLDSARVEWRDEYNDYSVRGVWTVVAR